MSRPAKWDMSTQRRDLTNDPHIGDALTGRQIQAADLLCEGLTYREIAGRMGCGIKTVEAHLRSCYQKAGVSRSLAFFVWWQKNRGAAHV